MLNHEDITNESAGVVTEMLGMLPPMDRPGCDLQSFSFFLKGAARMLFDRLDMDHNGLVDSTELSWMRSTFNCEIPVGRDLGVDEFMALFFRQCVAKLHDGSFRDVLLALLALLQAFRMQQQQSLDTPLGVALIEYWMTHQLGASYKDLERARQTVTVTVPQGDFHECLKHELSTVSWEEASEGFNSSAMSQDQFCAFVLKALGTIHTSTGCQEAVMHLLVGIGLDLQAHEELVSVAKQSDSLPLCVFQCVLAGHWRSVDQSHLLEQLVASVVQHCHRELQQQAGELQKSQTLEVDNVGLADTAARYADSW
eukprot:TRINITY_DN15134_c0_g1_i1.p1 TRINITY_DN15134_c0_g1~~TRINITY_DN15134_c0_g1_i1.p1  ORF type:complete len:311 (-),score=92.56 TRINITY_DN15134_c0_g1_i1:226-1158(-)